MKGTLHKQQSGWYIRTRIRKLNIPMHRDDHPDMDSCRFEGKEVEFETVPVCENCGHDWCDNLACRGQGDTMYARLLIPNQIVTEDILDTAIQVVGSDKVTTIKQFLKANMAFIDVRDLTLELKPSTDYPSVTNYAVKLICDKNYIIPRKVNLNLDWETKPKIYIEGLQSTEMGMDLVDEWYDKLTIGEARKLAEKYKIPHDLYEPWQMGHTTTRKEVYLAEHKDGLGKIYNKYNKGQ
jgi:hypothetical protein